MSLTLIKNVRVIDPASKLDAIRDILIEDRRIKSIEESIECECSTVIDGTFLIAAPGLVDMHVHLRDPGQTHKEDIISGCKAAAAGGVTSILAMPNTTPTTDSADIVKYIYDKAKNADAKVYVAASISNKLAGSAVNDYAALAQAGAIALTDDGRPVENTEIFVQALKAGEKHSMRILCHCEDLYLAEKGLINEGEISAQLGVKGIPRASEDADTARVIAIAAAYDLPIHICHVSTKGSVEIIRDAKKRGVKVTCETAPHYAAFTEQAVLSKDADYRMNPPLRTEADRLAICEGLRDGTIDVIATDHAPHTPQEKANFFSSPNGVIGMETSLAACLTYLSDEFTVNEIIEKMSVVPAKILGINAGSISVGSIADMVIFDMNEVWTVRTNKLHGKSRNCVFKDRKLVGRVKYTLLNGKIVYNDKDKEN